MESPYRILSPDRIVSDYGAVTSLGISIQAGVMAVSLENQLTKSVANARRQPMDLQLAQVPLGRVHVIAERCKECNFCIKYCPTEVLTYSDDINAKGYHYPIVAEGKESACVHCRFCDLICPELAIYTTEVADEKISTGEPDAR